ncbi:MAG: winged helix-turn-helix domain-containing protein [Thermoplasmata archaeon]
MMDPIDGRPGSRRREPSDLFATILEVVKRHRGRARITRISYGAGMPVDRLRVAVDKLLELGLLSGEDDDGRTFYDVTARGQEFLNTYWKMRGYMDVLGRSAAAPRKLSAERPT